MNDIDPYKVRIGGVIADPYRIAISFGLDSAIGEAAKKLLRCGRKHKDIKTDVQEAIKTLTRWLQIQDDIEREASIDSLRYVPSVPTSVLVTGTKTKMEEILDSKETTWP